MPLFHEKIKTEAFKKISRVIVTYITWFMQWFDLFRIWSRYKISLEANKKYILNIHNSCKKFLQWKVGGMILYLLVY